MSRGTESCIICLANRYVRKHGMHSSTQLDNKWRSHILALTYLLTVRSRHSLDACLHFDASAAMVATAVCAPATVEPLLVPQPTASHFHIRVRVAATHTYATTMAVTHATRMQPTHHSLTALER